MSEGNNEFKYAEGINPVSFSAAPFPVTQKNPKFLDAIKESARASKELLVEFGDLAIDAVVNSEVVDKIPVLKWIVATQQIRDSYIRKKISRNAQGFLRAVSEGDEEKYRKLSDEIGNDTSKRASFEESVLEILLEGERPIKATILGNLVRALAEAKISFQRFESLALGVYKCPVPALSALEEFFSIYKPGSLNLRITVDCTALLISAGFAVWSDQGTLPTDYGRAIFIHGFRGEIERPGETGS